MNNSTQMINFNGLTCVRLQAGGYEALVAYEVGSNVIRLRDNKNGLEFFRFNENNTADDIKQSAEVWDSPRFISLTALQTAFSRLLTRYIIFP